MNVPILAFSENVSGVDDPNNQGLMAVSEAYNIQFQQQEHSLAARDSKLSSLTQEAPRNFDTQTSNGQNNNNHILEANSSIHASNRVRLGLSTPKAKDNGGDPDKIFDPKPPTTLPVAIQTSGQKQNMTSASTQQPIQNVYQFNVRVNNNNMHGGGIIVGGDSNAQVQAQNSHGQIGQSKNNSSAYSTGVGKSKNRERRPASSKNQNNMQKTQQTNSAAVTGSGVYLGQNSGSMRKVVRKRPQSANRKLAAANVPLKVQSQVTSASFKSPGVMGSQKKHSFMFGGQLQSSQAPRSQHQRPQIVMNNQNHALSSELAMSDHSHGAISQLMPGNAHYPYTRTVKIPNSLNIQAMTFSGGKLQAGNMFMSPDKGARQNKSKIPSMTLQSREDLYEQNMQTKMQINSLKNENRKINTRVVVLENQLIQKDKLFEDMYKMAFSQTRYPSMPQNFQQQAALPTAVFHPQNQTMAQTSNATPNKSAYAPNQTVFSNNNQQHAQAQSLISNYKRTIRDQSKEILKRGNEIDSIKRSVKMTQINQVLIENEAYRTECIRLREQLEHTIQQSQQQQHLHQQSQMQQLQQHKQQTTLSQSSAGNTLQVADAKQDATATESNMETFKRDTQQPLVRSLGPSDHVVNQHDYDDKSSELRRNKEQIEQMREHCDAQDNEIKSLQRENEILSNEKAKVKQSADQQNERNQKLQSEADSLKRKLQDTKTHLEQMTQQAQRSAAQITANAAAAAAHTTNTNEHTDEKSQQSDFTSFKTSQIANSDKVESVFQDQIEQLEMQNSNLQAQKFELETKLETIEAGTEKEKNQEIQSLQKQLQDQKSKCEELKVELESLTNQRANDAEEMKKLSEKNGLVMKKAKSFSDAAMKSQKVNEQRGNMLNQKDGQISDLEEQVKELQERLKDNSKLQEQQEDLKKELLYKTNALEAQKFDFEKQLGGRDAQIMELKQQLVMIESKQNANYQSPPLAQGHVAGQGRRSTKKKAAVDGSAKGSLYGGSSFDRAESDAPPNQVQADQQYSEDRSDLGFSSNEDEDEPLPTNKAAEPIQQKKVAKIAVNDMTIFGPDGFPLSPKEVTKDSPAVKEGFLRLRYACQVKMIRHDSIENFLFGNSYKPETKITISTIKESAINQLQMSPTAALDFARYLVEQGGSITYDQATATDQYVTVDQSKALLGIRIIMSITSKIQPELVYYRPEKEEKMKLIIGEKLQDQQSKTKIISTIQRHNGECLLEEEFRSLFEQANLHFNNKETLQCCFIFLLKQTEDLMRIRKADLINFIHTVGKQANDFTMTGSKFPMEMELVYSSDSDDGIADEVNENGQLDDAQKEATYKSAKVTTTTAVEQQPMHAAPERQYSADNQVPDFKNFQSAQPNQNANQIVPQVEDEDSDDDFGANESRSEYSNKIPEEIKSEHASESSNKPQPYLSVTSQHASNTVEDSINDRDLDSSVAKMGALNPPLTKVVEAQEHQECTIEPDQKAKKQQKEENENDLAVIKQGSVSRNNSMPVNEMNQNPSNTMGKKSSENGSSGAMSQTSQGTGNGQTGMRKARRMQKLKIDVVAVKKAQNLKEQPPLPSHGQIGKAAPIISVVEEDKSGRSEGQPLQVLKPDAPVPFGITVTHQQTSEYGGNGDSSRAMTPENQSDQKQEQFQQINQEVSKFEKVKSLDVPVGITVTHQQHSEYGGSQYSEPSADQDNNQAPKKTSVLEESFQDSEGLDVVNDFDIQVGQKGEKEQLEEEIRKQKPPIIETKTVTVNDLVTEQSSSTMSNNQPEISYRDMSVDQDPNKNVEESKTTAPSQTTKEIKNKDASANIIAITNVDDGNNESMIDMMKHHNISLPSASRLVDDSFGQNSYQKLADKPKSHIPPIELLQLKEKVRPSGIQINELLTERSARPGDTESAAQINDFNAGKDSEDYSEDPDEDEYIQTQSNQSSLIQHQNQNQSPADLKAHMQKGGQQESAITPILVSGAVSSRQSEIEEDYEF